jgi:hypothetical protein
MARLPIKMGLVLEIFALVSSASSYLTKQVVVFVSHQKKES